MDRTKDATSIVVVRENNIQWLNADERSHRCNGPAVIWHVAEWGELSTFAEWWVNGEYHRHKYLSTLDTKVHT